MRTCGTCPFCGLLCGGVSFPPSSASALSTDSQNTNCERLSQRWHLAQPTSSWQLKPLRLGRALEKNVALAEVAQLLGQSRRTLFCGLATDVAGMRQVIDFARLVGGVLDHMHSDALQLNLKLLQHGGWIATTLSEIRFRADAIVLVGDSLLDRFPRLLTLLANESRPMPKLFWLGTDDIRFRTQALLVPDAQTISLKKGEWLPALSSLLRQVSCKSEHELENGKLGAETAAAIHTLHQGLKAAQYATLIWSAADFPADGDELILDVLVRLVTKWNETSRAAVLPLAGSNGDVTAQQVCTWKTGFPLRQALSPMTADYQPNRYRTLDVLRQKDCDVAVYVSAFEPIEPPEEFWGVAGPKIIVGHPGLKSAARADYFFPSGIPGIDHESHLFRGDGVAVVSLERKRESLAPAVADWFDQLKSQYMQQHDLSESSRV